MDSKIVNVVISLSNCIIHEFSQLKKSLEFNYLDSKFKNKIRAKSNPKFQTLCKNEYAKFQTLLKGEYESLSTDEAI
ncbi:39855_t:CDS:2 [Gigaspora margarita]|uniref:39855_t:CDS:1 n=1 Tax=Gigaspora margarita TaxID=4874 RepID=A0ABM8W510_GIGMA|nr:39855_t:CDS:2 [Gigaspora margarita]